MFKVLLLGGVGIIPMLYPDTVLAAPSVERGEYLVTGPAGCGNCHTPLGAEGPDFSKALGGRLVDKNPAFTAYAPNCHIPRDYRRAF